MFVLYDKGYIYVSERWEVDSVIICYVCICQIVSPSLPFLAFFFSSSNLTLILEPMLQKAQPRGKYIPVNIFMLKTSITQC